MKIARRLIWELGLLYKSTNIVTLLTYTAAIIMRFRSILLEKSLAPADHFMAGKTCVTLKNCGTQIPVGNIDRMVCHVDPTPTFGGIRELFFQDVYMRGFVGGEFSYVIDLGGNRGLFSLLSVKRLNARTALSVEPGQHFSCVPEILCQYNGIDRSRMPRFEGFIAKTSGPDQISLGDLYDKFGVDHVDLMKIDIEGAEFDIICDPAAFVIVDNITMEVHRDKGSVDELLNFLRMMDFEYTVADQFGHECNADQAHYIYASKVGKLLRR